MQKKGIPHVEVDADIHRKLKLFSVATNQSMRQVATIAISEWIDRHQKEQEENPCSLIAS